jgi:hypothetical protein
VVEEAAGAVGRVERSLRLIAELFEEIAEWARLVLARRQVDVGVLASERRPCPIGGAGPDGDAAEQADVQAAGRRLFHEAAALSE